MAGPARHGDGVQTEGSLADTEVDVGDIAPMSTTRFDARLVRIALIFVTVFAVLDGILLWTWNTKAFYDVRLWTAAAASALINVSGVPATRLGTSIYLSSRILQIDSDCTALLVLATFVSLLVAYPVSLRTKATGLLVGAPALLAANQLRLVAVAQASEMLLAASFAFAHDYLFKVFMVAVVIGLWAWWLAYARRQARH